MKSNIISMVNDEDFTFVDFTPSKGNERFHGNVVRIRQSYIYFSSDLRAIITKKKLTHIRVRIDNITGDIHFIFNRTKGLEFGTFEKSRQFSNKQMAEFLRNEANKHGTLEDTINITLGEDTANSDDYATFKLNF